jgi:hypothetical protein
MKNKCNLIAFAAAGGLLLSTSLALASDDNETYGAITAVSPNGISVAGVGFVFGSNVECEYLNKVNFPCSQLAVGDMVEVEWTGNRIAREIKLYNSVTPTPTPSPTASPSPTATPGEGRGRENKSKLSVRLRSDDVGVRPSGKAEFESKKKEQKLSIKVKIPEGSSPLIESLEDAEALLLKAQIVRDSAVYAECDFELDDDSNDDDDQEVNIYEFKVDVRTKKGTLREKSGSCVIDPAGAATAGLPQLKRRDTVTIIEDAAGEFLTGTIK